MVVKKEAFCQIGIVVRDIERAVAEYARLFNVPVPQIIVTDPVEKAHTEYMRRPTKARAKLAFFQMEGGISLELIEPDEEPSTWREFLAARGEGVHHMAFNVQDMDETVSSMAEMGITLVQRGDYEGGRYAYLDARSRLGVLLELLENR